MTGTRSARDDRSEPDAAREEGPGTIDARTVEGLEARLDELAPRLPGRVDADPDDLARGLGRLVLSLVEFLRQVLEKQAVRRMETGTLTDDEVERLGTALMRLRDRMEELKVAFDLADDDLRLRFDPAPLQRPVEGEGGHVGRQDANR